jgi:hypothetical protein
MFEPFTSWAVWWNQPNNQMRFWLDASDIFYVPPAEAPRPPTSAKDMAAHNPAIAAMLAQMDAQRIAAEKKAAAEAGLPPPVFTPTASAGAGSGLGGGGLTTYGGIGGEVPTVPTVTVAEDGGSSGSGSGSGSSSEDEDSDDDMGESQLA